LAGNPLETIKGWKLRGWNIRVKKVKGHLYITAYKKIDGKQKEKCICRVNDEIIAFLKEHGILANNVPCLASKAGKLAGNGVSKKSRSRVTRVSSISSSKQVHESQVSQGPRFPVEHHQQRGVGGSWAWVFMVHRLQLRYVRNDVSPLFLRFCGFSFDSRNKQWVRRFGLGRGRWVTVQVNRDGSAQVYLEASDAPLDLFEFVGFCRFYLLSLFRQLTGRDVCLNDFAVLAAPEFNVDLPGVNLVEGLGVNGKCVTLQEYYDNLVRIYLKGPCSTMPNGGSRIEARPSGYSGLNLRDLVDGVVLAAELPRFLADLRRDIAAIRSGLSGERINVNELSEVVASKIANLEYLLFRKMEEKIKQWIREVVSALAEKVDKYLGNVFRRLQELEEENKRLKEELMKLKKAKRHADRQVHVAVPEMIRHLLDKLSEPGAARPALISVDYSKGMVYFSEDLWKYINSRTWYGKRGLDNELLNKIKLYDGYDAYRLILFLKKHGGKAPLYKVVKYLSQGGSYG